MARLLALYALVAVLLTLVAMTVMVLPVAAEEEALIESSTVTYTVNPSKRVARMVHKMSYDLLFKLKVECGRGMYFSMEPMPAYDQEISIPNARHLLIYSVKPDYL